MEGKVIAVIRHTLGPGLRSLKKKRQEDNDIKRKREDTSCGKEEFP